MTCYKWSSGGGAGMGPVDNEGTSELSVKGRVLIIIFFPSLDITIHFGLS